MKLSMMKFNRPSMLSPRRQEGGDVMEVVGLSESFNLPTIASVPKFYLITNLCEIVTGRNNMATVNFYFPYLISLSSRPYGCYSNNPQVLMDVVKNATDGLATHLHICLHVKVST